MQVFSLPVNVTFEFSPSLLQVDAGFSFSPSPSQTSTDPWTLRGLIGECALCLGRGSCWVGEISREYKNHRTGLDVALPGLWPSCAQIHPVLRPVLLPHPPSPGLLMSLFPHHLGPFPHLPHIFKTWAFLETYWRPGLAFDIANLMFLLFLLSHSAFGKDTQGFSLMSLCLASLATHFLLIFQLQGFLDLKSRAKMTSS